MNKNNNDYKNRLIDEKIDTYLEVFGAISVQGPKWCGKTWTSLNHSNSSAFMTESETKNLAKTSPKYIFNENKPQLIDEWQLVPSIWDAVRHECDKNHDKGKFILTGSTTLTKAENEEEVFHSGTGRIAIMKMYPMSLYESGDSNGAISISDMYNDTVKCSYQKKIELNEIAHLLVRGGWPENLYVKREQSHIIPESYIDSIVNRDINERKDKKRDSKKMQMLIRSLARNSSSIAGFETIVKDIEETENSEVLLSSRQTVADYIGVLDNLFLIFNQEAYNINYRSSQRVGKSPKRHLIDPSLACAAMSLSEEKLITDFNTFGLLFESMVQRDLLIYMDYLGGKLFHFRDNQSSNEVDSILEFRDGTYAAIEIKLTSVGIEDAKKSLLEFHSNVSKKPVFMCIIVGHYEAIVKDPETGIYIIPITALKP